MNEAEREAERRRATILFADLTGFTALVERGDEEAYSVVTECLKLMDAIARRHGAFVDKYMGDCVMALFGVPLAIENAPRAAVNAAIEMLREVPEYGRRCGVARPLGIHIGIDTGSIVSGDVRGSVVREVAVIGDAVNLASRLKDLAPVGEVYVGPETWRSTRAEFEYQAHAPIPIKGKQQPVPVYQLLSRKERIHKPRAGSGLLRSPLVGRDTELAGLRRALADLAVGVGGVVSVVAEAGVGKSRLLGELAASPEASDLLWLEGRSVSTGRELGYHPFVDLLRGWLGLRDHEDEADARERLAAALESSLGREAADVLPFLGSLLHVPLEEAERTRLEAMRGDARETFMHRAIERLFSRLAAQGQLVLVFDDLQWADRSSVELLESLIRSPALANELFLLAFRPGFDDSSGRLLRTAREARGAQHREVALVPLARPDAGRLLDNLLGGEAPEPLRQRILDKTSGNPFYIEEVVRSLLESQVLAQRDGRIVATERTAEAVIPGTVQEVIMARIDRLPPTQRHVLEAAAVIGARFALPVLAEVTEKENLEALLGEFEAAGLVVGPADGLGTPYAAFKHPLIQEVAYGTLLRARRRELHRRVAGAIESVLSDRVPGFDAMLAWHYAAAEETERAERYLFRAGEEATRTAASTEALSFFRRAAELYFRSHGEGGDPAKKAALERSVAMAYFNRGELTAAVDHFTAALVHRGERPSREGLAGWAAFGRDLAAAAAGLVLGTWRRPRAPATPVQREIIDLRFRRCLSQSATSPQFVFDTLATLRQLARVDPRSVPEAGGIYAGAIGVFSWGGISFSLGRRTLELAREVTTDSELRALQLYAQLMEFVHYYLLGDWSDAHAVEDDVLVEGERYGRLWEVQTWLDLDAERRTHQGRFELASERIEELASFAERYDHDMARAASQYQGAWLSLARRDLADARAGFERYHAEHAEASLRLVALAARAKVEVLDDRIGAAAGALAQAAEVEARGGLMAPFYRVRLAAARLLHAAAELESAAGAGDAPRVRRAERAGRRHGRTARRLAGRVAAFRPEVLRVTGTVEWLGGRQRRALESWRRSLESAERLGARPELGRTHAEVARRLAEGRGPTELAGLDAAGHRAAARRVFVEHGLERDLDALDAP